MSRILVIGATGNIGREVIAQLPIAANTRALVRNPEKANLAPHVEIAPGDLTDPETLDAALHNVDAVFLVWTAPPNAIEPALAKIAHHAKRIVFLSSPWQTRHPFFQKPQPNPMSKLHAHIEQLIKDAGREWTFLRPGMFASNALRWWSAPIRAGKPLRWPYLAAPTAPIDERDIAAVAARALCSEGHDHEEYLITGPESLTQRDQIEIIGRRLGRNLEIEEIAPDEARRELLPNMLLAAWEGAMEAPALITTTVAEVTGSPARTFHDWVADHLTDFQP